MNNAKGLVQVLKKLLCVAPLWLAATPLFAADVLFIVGDTTLSNADAVIVNLLELQGHDVQVVDDSASAATDADGKDLVIVSESVNSGAVGDKFNQVAVPLIVYEAWLYDNLGLTGQTQFTHYGYTDGQTQLDIVGSHPLTAGLTGTVTVGSSAARFSWGQPGTEAIVAATLEGEPGLATSFAYEAGSQLANFATAPARRVALHPNADSGGGAIDVWTANGQALFNAAVEWALGPQTNQPPVVDAGSDTTGLVGVPMTLNGFVTDDGVSLPLTVGWEPQAGASFGDATDPGTSVTFASAGSYTLTLTASDPDHTVSDTVTIDVDAPSAGGRQVLLVVGNTSLSSADAVIVNLLELQSHDVQIVDDSASAATDADGKDLVVVSESVNSGAVGDKFNQVAVPIIVYEAWLYDNLGLTGPTAFTHYSYTDGQTQLDIVGSHPLTAGLTGTVTVGSSAARFSWGQPGAEAIVAATLAGEPGLATSFAYEAGSQLADLSTAVARRVALHPNSEGSSSAIDVWTANGQALFNAAVEWALGPQTNQPPDVNAGADSTAVAGVAVSLGGIVTDDGVSLPLTIGWEPQAGASFDDATDPGTTVTFASAGSYTLTLTASDPEFTVSDTVTFDVDAPPANLPPVVDAGPDAAASSGVPLTLNGFVSDDGVSLPLTVGWEPEAGTSFDDATDPGTTVTFASAGTYILTLTAEDPEFSVSDTVTIEVDAAPENQPPTVNAGPDTTAVAGLPLTLGGVVTDDGVSLPLTVGWEPTAGASFDDATNPGTSVTFASAGSYTLTLTAEDPEFSVSDTVTIDVDAPSAGGRQVLFIVGNPASLSSADAVIVNLLELQSHDVQIVDDSASAATDADGKDLVVVSESVNSGAVGDKFNQVAVPIIVYEAWLYDNLGLTGSTAFTHYGYTDGQTQLDIVGSHPLTAGLTGTVTVGSSAARFSWGVPGTEAIVAATLTGEPGLATSFAYEAGSQLADFATAPARRVALHPNADAGGGAIDVWTANGQALFNAAVQWTLDAPPPPPVVRILPLGDSITHGIDDHWSYRRDLTADLTAAECSYDMVGSLWGPESGAGPGLFDRDHEGHRGFRTDRILDELPGWLPGNTPDWVLLHLGTNDVLQGTSLSAAADNIVAIIELLRGANPNVGILLAQIIPNRPTNETAVITLNDSIAAIAAAEDQPGVSPIVLVDQYTDYSTAVHNYDDVHPNELGEALIAERWRQALLPRLSGFCGAD